MSFSAMPMPVSVTEMISSSLVPERADAHLSADIGELHGIAQKIDQHLLQAAFIRAHKLHVGIDFFEKADVRRIRLMRDHPQRIRNELLQSDDFLVELAFAGIDARDIENVVDQREQMLAAGMNVLHIFLVAGTAERTESSPWRADPKIR